MRWPDFPRYHFPEGKPIIQGCLRDGFQPSRDDSLEALYAAIDLNDDDAFDEASIEEIMRRDLPRTNRSGSGNRRRSRSQKPVVSHEAARRGRPLNPDKHLFERVHTTLGADVREYLKLRDIDMDVMIETYADMVMRHGQ